MLCPLCRATDLQLLGNIATMVLDCCVSIFDKQKDVSGFISSNGITLCLNAETFLSYCLEPRLCLQISKRRRLAACLYHEDQVSGGDTVNEGIAHSHRDD